jgi:hypothetical protein
MLWSGARPEKIGRRRPRRRSAPSREKEVESVTDPVAQPAVRSADEMPTDAAYLRITTEPYSQGWMFRLIAMLGRMNPLRRPLGRTRG